MIFLISNKITIFETLKQLIRNMKTHLYWFTILLLSTQSIIAQEVSKNEASKKDLTLVGHFTGGKKLIENSEMNLHFFTSANANFSDSNFEGMNFKLNRVRLEIKGTMWDRLSYHYRII